MTTDFFAGFQTAAEIKTRYRELARQFHPDLGGCLETMKAINCQYHARLKGESGKEFDGHKYTYNNKTEQEIMDKIAELVKLQDLQVDLWLRLTPEGRASEAEQVRRSKARKRNCDNL